MHIKYRNMGNFKRTGTVFALVLLLSVNAFGADGGVKLNGRTITSKTINDNGRILVPFRDIFEALGFSVEWDNGRILAENKEMSMELQAGSDIIITSDKNMNSRTFECGTDVKIIDDRAYVPLRAVAERTGFEVEWDDSSKTVDIYGSTDIPEINQNETEVMLDYPVSYSFEDKDLKYIENFIIKNIDDKFDVKNFDIKENSLTEVNGRVVFGVLSLNYVKNGFVTDWGYDFYVQNGLASKLVIMGDPVDPDITEVPDMAEYTDTELKDMTMSEIELQKNEEITEQRVLRRYRDGKYICAVVTEITNRSSGISRGEYFELVL